MPRAAGRGADAAPALQPVERRRQVGDLREAHVVRIGVGALRRRPPAVGVDREAVAGRRLEAAAAAAGEPRPAVAAAAEPAQEQQRAHHRVGVAQALAARGERADHDLRARVGGLDRRVGGADQSAVQVRRHRRAAAPRAARLRGEPRRDVRLVPEDVAVDARPVAAGDGLGERRERGRPRPVGAAAPAGLGARPHGSGAGDVERHVHTGRAHARDRVVEEEPLIVRVGRVAGVEAARLAGGRDPRPQREDPHGVDAARAPLGDGLVGQRAARHEDAVVGDPDLSGAGMGGRGRHEGQEKQERKEASHVCAQRLPPVGVAPGVRIYGNGCQSGNTVGSRSRVSRRIPVPSTFMT